MLISPTSIFITLLEVKRESEPNVHFLVDPDGESSYTHHEIESSEEFPMAQNTALEWERAYDRVTLHPWRPHPMNPHRNPALRLVGDVFEALGRAEAQADAALREGRVIYTGRLGFAQRNLLECWFWWAGLTRLHPQPAGELMRARKLLIHSIAQYRQLRDQQRSGIVGRLNGATA
jgi:hypothetical protein